MSNPISKEMFAEFAKHFGEYKAPDTSRWVGLTDQEIGQVFQEKCTKHGQLLNERAFRIAARWAEEKLKEKNT